MSVRVPLGNTPVGSTMSSNSQAPLLSKDLTTRSNPLHDWGGETDDFEENYGFDEPPASSEKQL